MELSKAIQRFRINPLNDTIPTYLWSDLELITYFNEAQEEFAEKTFLLIDSETPEVCQIIVGVSSSYWAKGTNPATLKTSISFKFYNQYTEKTFPVTDNISMTACAAQAVSTYCKYIVATDGSNNVTVLKGADATTSDSAILPLVTEELTPIGMFMIQTDGVTTFTSGTNSLDDAGITCTFLSSDTKFTTHSKVLRIDSADLNHSRTEPLKIKDYYWMNESMSTWKTTDPGIPRILVSKKNTRQYQIWPAASYPDKLTLTVARRPLADMEIDTEFEIPEEFVKYLYDLIAHKCFGKQDAETFDSERAMGHFKKWQMNLEGIKREELRRNETKEVCTPTGSYL